MYYSTIGHQLCARPFTRVARQISRTRRPCKSDAALGRLLRGRELRRVGQPVRYGGVSPGRAQRFLEEDGGRVFARRDSNKSASPPPVPRRLRDVCGV